MIINFRIPLAWTLTTFLFVVGLVFLVGPVASAQTANFVSVIDDLPLMPGLEEDSEAAMTFDSATGRIAEAEARGQLTSDTIQGFYAQSLPQLGWQSLSGGKFQRGDEELSLEIVPASDGGASVRFRLKPAGAK
ncbi:MAG: hypothetical protein HOH04_16140 [Rhodospirillaceae bacterium]|jgi:hypothetical protein|nr:hypothetical protein [Rhodospirillaceae bacterium]